MSEKTCIVWLSPSGPRSEEHKDVRYAETRAKELREFLLAEEWRGTVEVIYPSEKDACNRVRKSAPTDLFGEKECK